MAGKSKEMSKIKQVIQLHRDGMSNRAIGRELDLYKGTVNKYLALAEADSLGLDNLCKLDDPVLERHLCGGNPAYSDKRFDELQERVNGGQWGQVPLTQEGHGDRCTVCKKQVQEECLNKRLFPSPQSHSPSCGLYLCLYGELRAYCR